MLVLLGFALLAGAGTALSPCVLPVLPALLSASGTGGRRRPAGIVLGLVSTFTVAVVALAALVDGIGLAGGLVRWLAIGVLALFGVLTLLPGLGERLRRPLAGLQRLGPRSRGRGFWSGLVAGGALGFVYAPCAGPILAGVIAVAATRGPTLELVLVALAYGAGTGVVLGALAVGGQRAGERIRATGREPALRVAVAVVMLATAGAMAAGLDIRAQTAIATGLPGVVANPTGALERAPAVQDRLAGLHGPSRFASASASARGTSPALPVLGRAPGFVNTQRWFNTPGDRPLTLGALRGRVVLVDFWTYTCVNCIRTFGHLRAWDERYRDAGLTIVGVHTPEFAFERDAGNVAAAIDRHRLRYPVAQDNEFATWLSWHNRGWPAKYLVDREGNVRYGHLGEGAYEETEAAIRALLAERREQLALPPPTSRRAETISSHAITPETYLGHRRAAGFLPHVPLPGARRRHGPPANALPAGRFALRGGWRVSEAAATAGGGAELAAHVLARDVNLVLAPPPRGAGIVRVAVDGRPVSGPTAGRDVGPDGIVRVDEPRMYRLVAGSRPAPRRLTLRFAPGVSGYAFTFG